MTELDADRTLALTYAPAKARDALAALWHLDATLGNVLAGGREPMLSQIKLAWWREALEKLDHSKAPTEPTLQAVASQVIPAGVSGADLSRLEESWTVLLSQEPLTEKELSRYAARGSLLFGYSAQILGGPLTDGMEQAGEGWALVDLARNSNAVDAEAALAMANARLAGLESIRWPSRLRSFGMLGHLALRDVSRGLAQLEPHGAPKRMMRMLRHRITGR